MSPTDQQNLRVVEQGNGNNGNGNGNGIVQTEKKRLHLDSRFIISIKGKDFALYSGLLDLAHQMGLKALKVQPVQYPTKENGFEAICKAIAETKDGKVTEDIGDCNPTNCHVMVSKHLLRMASTRAKARALRDLTNIGITCIDEIGDFDEVIGEEIPPETKPRTRRRSTNKSKVDKSSNDSRSDISAETPSNGGKSEEHPKGNNDTDSRQSNNGSPKMSNAQRIAIESLSRRMGLKIQEIDRMSREMYNISFEHLSNSDASSLIQHLQQPV